MAKKKSTDPFDISFDEPLWDDGADVVDEPESEPPGTMETRCTEEFSKIKAEFAERGKREQQRFELNTDSEYWVCLIFPTRAHCEEFLTNSGVAKLGDKYVDGCAAAKILKVGMSLPMPEFPKSKIDRTWAEFPSIPEI